jgi:hypothetical protein
MEPSPPPPKLSGGLAASTCTRSSLEIACARCRCTVSSVSVILREHIMIFIKEKNIFYQIHETVDQYTCSYYIIQVLSKITKKFIYYVFLKTEGLEVNTGLQEYWF